MVKVISKERQEPLKQQLDEIFEKKGYQTVKRNWDDFFGKVKFDIDPVAYQRKLRDEQ